MKKIFSFALLLAFLAPLPALAVGQSNPNTTAKQRQKTIKKYQKSAQKRQRKLAKSEAKQQKALEKQRQ